MAIISLKNKVSDASHVLVITEKFVSEFNLPDKVNNYIAEEFKQKDKKTLTYNYIGKYISIIIIDPKKEANALNEQLRKHGAGVADGLNAHKAKEVYIYNQTKLPLLSLVAAEGIALSNYQFIPHKTKDKNENELMSIFITNSKINAKLVDELNAVCEATTLARNLVNEPVNILNAVALSDAFKKMGKEAGFKVEVYKKEKITQLKMGGILAVNAGSVDEPTFSIMEYKPANAKNKKPYVLVGKGVVYDTGGLSLKPTANSMDMMKCDMAGAAAVGCAMYAIAKAKLNVHVIALVPATDNRPGFNAFAPGDIITMMDGSTVEMLNSDAEGRMILADALHFAKRYTPELTIDVATLTGAAAAAIGSFGIVGMGTAKEKHKERLQQSGLRVHERIAEFPFWEEYGDLMKSDIADQKNLGGAFGGAITAGKFLEKFTDYPYYHLDIAGPAFITAKDSYRTKGGTGVGVRLFFDLFKHL
ncbi:leucyl aminopeptidase family protein [Aurantibacillus circumpalustris]|uniref:leucyl aminopeptidase family protein n=1 Tax=Aurantibacillus circumpalustris TaxID=3036359 RepID=UPI00295ADC22|nr:leucyl aminopeptidase [Aurantibacillus circumpalustris]